MLAAKPSGCVVFMWFDGDTLALGPFGSRRARTAPARLSGMRVGRHTKANAKGVKAKRQAIRVVPLSRFEKHVSIDAVVASLFGLQGSPSSEEGT